MEDRVRNTVLYKFWGRAVLLAWLHYLVVLIGMEWNHLTSTNPLCPYTDKGFPLWFWYSSQAVFGGYVFVLVMLLMKVLMTNSILDRVPYYPTINMVFMGGLATGLALFRNWGGTCVDVFGVALPASIWAEWLATGPLLYFITLSVVDKENLSYEDISVIITFWLTIVFGYLIVIDQPYWLACTWLILSCLVYGINIWQSILISRKSIAVNPESVQASDLQRLSENMAKKTNLVLVLTGIMPWIFVAYLLALFRLIDSPTVIAIFLILSCATKGLFAAVTTDAHIQLLNPATRALIEERRANEARRAFLRYIFHEVRTPLNSLTMGIEIFERSDHLDDAEQESLVMMKDASTFMSETLNDVLSMQKIEEGKLELELNPFSLHTTLSKVCSTFKGALRNKNLRVVIDIPSDFPTDIIGDRFRIEHVMSNLLSNAIKFSPPNASVTMSVMSKKRDAIDKNRIFLDVTVSCIDEGPGIAEADQMKLFTNFMQIQPGALQSGQGTGIGLSLCKQIVTLHGGTIGYKNADGPHGSAFFFTIPFEVANERQNVKGTRDRTQNTAFVERSEPTEFVKNGTSTTAVQPFDTLLDGASDAIDNKIRKSLDLTMTAKRILPLQQRQYEVLVVDDVESNRKMLSMLLRKERVITGIATDGDEAVQIIANNLEKYRLILMDNFMVRMNGVEATRAIRQVGYKYIIAGVTGNVLEDDIRSYLKAGADIVLAKPLQVTNLVNLLTHIDIHGGVSQPAMKLSQSAGVIAWVAKETNEF